MTLVRPPITGDPQMDSWTDQLTRQINLGILGNTGQTTEIADGGGQGDPGTNGINAASVYLYQRTVLNTAPTDFPDDATFTFADGTVVADGAGSLNGWATDISEGTGEYIWVILQYSSTLAATDTLATGSWTAITLLSVPGEDAFTILIEAKTPGDDEAIDITQYSGWLDTSDFFKNNMGANKALLATVGTPEGELTDAQHRTRVNSYTWFKNGLPFTAPEEMQQTNTGTTERAVIIGVDDIVNNGEDAFACTINFT